MRTDHPQGIDKRASMDLVQDLEMGKSIYDSLNQMCFLLITHRSRNCTSEVPCAKQPDTNGYQRESHNTPTRRDLRTTVRKASNIRGIGASDQSEKQEPESSEHLHHLSLADNHYQAGHHVFNCARRGHKELPILGG
jgi:hypothetical protein